MASVLVRLKEDNTGFYFETPLLIPLRWRYKTTPSYSLAGELYKPFTNSPNVTKPGLSVSYGGWNTGGQASASREVCYYQNGSGFATRRASGVIEAPAGSGWAYEMLSSKHLIKLEDTIPEIDWESVMSTVRSSYSPSLNSIGVVRLCNSAGEETQDLVAEGLLSLDELNSYFKDTNHTGEEVTGDILNPETEHLYTDVDSNENDPDGNDIILKFTENLIVTGISNNDAGKSFGETVSSFLDSPTQNTCVSNGRTMDMYIKVWVKIDALGSGSYPDDAAEKPEDVPDTPDNWNPLTSGSGSTGSGSQSQGMNTIESSYGNSVLPFDSVYLTGSDYNSLVSAGSGFVAESGVFPKTDTLYIENIRLDVGGSTMTVVEVVDYDATPTLTLSEKIYAYIFTEDNKTKPVFSSFVISRRSRLNSGTKEIVYECRDLNYFLDQMYTPSHYIYRPPSLEGAGTDKNYERVVKEILNVAGIPDAVIDLPNYTAPPTSWVYQDVRSVLEWVTKFFGKYVYYIDRYGRLNIKATDSGSSVKSYTIGDKSGEIAVESFEPMADFSRSRSRVVLTGDYEITEHEALVNYTLGGQLHPEDNSNQTGIFWFYETIDGVQHKFYYFMFKPGRTLNGKLLTDPSKSAEVTLYPRGELKERRDMSIKVFKNDPGDSEIYVEDPILNVGGTQRIRTRYATRSNSPIQVSVDTQYTGGTEVVRRPQFKKATSEEGVIDDTPLMRKYLSKIKDFYAPVYGGHLVLDGLDTEITLLDKVSIAGTSLSSNETDDLICYAIEYNVPSKRTSVDLSNKVYGQLPFFSIMRERTREQNELIAKVGLVEESELYQRR